MKPSELFKSVYASAIDEGGPHGMTGITFEHAVRDSDKDGVMAEKILALLEAVESADKEWLEIQRDCPCSHCSSNRPLIRAALALKEATDAKSAAGGHKRASRGDK